MYLKYMLSFGEKNVNYLKIEIPMVNENNPMRSRNSRQTN